MIVKDAEFETRKFNTDSAGIAGDVRDVLLFRRNPKGNVVWEIGISAKTNHEAVKHSRISLSIDFGHEWLGMQCSKQYMGTVAGVFEQVNFVEKKMPAALSTNEIANYRFLFYFMDAPDRSTTYHTLEIEDDAA